MKNFAFTLAEVLITLGIIGIVAAMTLPSLIQKQQKVETITRLKKAYSVVSQAFKMAEAKYGPADSWSEWDDAEVILDKYIIPEIKGAKKYGKATSSKLPLCYDSNKKLHNTGTDTASQYVWLSGVYITSPFDLSTASFSLPDGTCIGLNGAVFADERYPDNFKYNIFVDVNNTRGPNIAGEDLFFFVLKNNQVRPYGFDAGDEAIKGTVSNACNRRAVLGGYRCAARIMSEGWQINY